jgi:hypothetical protein
MLSWWEGKVGTEQPEFIVDQNLGLTSQTDMSIEQTTKLKIARHPTSQTAMAAKFWGAF